MKTEPDKNPLYDESIQDLGLFTPRTEVSLRLAEAHILLVKHRPSWLIGVPFLASVVTVMALLSLERLGGVSAGNGFALCIWITLVVISYSFAQHSIVLLHRKTSQDEYL